MKSTVALEVSIIPPMMIFTQVFENYHLVAISGFSQEEEKKMKKYESPLFLFLMNGCSTTLEVFKRQNFFSKLVQLKIFMKESTWSWSQVIWTSPFCAILVQNLDYFWPFQGVRVLKMQK